MSTTAPDPPRARELDPTPQPPPALTPYSNYQRPPSRLLLHITNPNLTMAPAGIASIPSTGVGSLSTLLKRLEAATSRLEDIAVAQQSAPPATSPVSSASALQPNQSLTGLGVGAVGGAALAGGVAAVAHKAEAPAQAVAPSVTAFEELRNSAVAHFVALSHELGGLIGEQVSTSLKVGLTSLTGRFEHTPSSPASNVS